MEIKIKFMRHAIIVDSLMILYVNKLHISNYKIVGTEKERAPVWYRAPSQKQPGVQSTHNPPAMILTGTKAYMI